MAESSDRRSTNPHAVRKRAQRGHQDPRSAAEQLYGKPVSEWDDDELAHGQPRDEDGKFHGRPPAWLTDELNAEAQRRFRTAIRKHLNVSTQSAVKIIRKLMEDEREDDDGRFKVAAGVRLNAAQFLVEQAVGKATQPVDVTAEIKMVGLLGNVVLNPGDQPTQGFEEWDSTAQQARTADDPERDDDQDLAGA